MSDEEYEVVWSGKMELLPPRLTKAGDLWEPPKRMYNKKSKVWKQRECDHEFADSNVCLKCGWSPKETK